MVYFLFCTIVIEGYSTLMVDLLIVWSCGVKNFPPSSTVPNAQNFEKKENLQKRSNRSYVKKHFFRKIDLEVYLVMVFDIFKLIIYIKIHLHYNQL